MYVNPWTMFYSQISQLECLHLFHNGTMASSQHFRKEWFKIVLHTPLGPSKIHYRTIQRKNRIIYASIIHTLVNMAAASALGTLATALVAVPAKCSPWQNFHSIKMKLWRFTIATWTRLQVLSLRSPSMTDRITLQYGRWRIAIFDKLDGQWLPFRALLYYLPPTLQKNVLPTQWKHVVGEGRCRNARLISKCQ